MVANAAAVHPAGVPVVTPSFSQTFISRVVNECHEIRLAGGVVVFAFAKGDITFFRLGDTLFQHPWFDSPLAIPLRHALQMVGVKLAPQKVLSLDALDTAIDARRIGEELEDCRCRGLEGPESETCHKERDRLADLLNCLKTIREQPLF